MAAANDVLGQSEKSCRQQDLAAPAAQALSEAGAGRHRSSLKRGGLKPCDVASSGGETPQTGTPPPRSASPSSDSSVPPDAIQLPQEPMAVASRGLDFGSGGMTGARRKAHNKHSPDSPDGGIFRSLAATEKTHRQLLTVAEHVSTLLKAPAMNAAVASVELYGSLALGTVPRTPGRRSAYYVNPNSDVDLVVELQPGTPPDMIAESLIEQGWRMSAQTEVHKFATTQYTFVKRCGDKVPNTEVDLDVTCIASPTHFHRFNKRQQAFRQVFCEVRARMEHDFGPKGLLAFDAYVQLLKVFAAKIPNNAITGFQALCVGLFTIQIRYFQLKPSQSIAVSLFEGFLRFCATFYSDLPSEGHSQQATNYKTCCMDLTFGGRLFPRCSEMWKSELYLVATEEALGTQPNERVNTAHSLDPAPVALEAQTLLEAAWSPCS